MELEFEMGVCDGGALLALGIKWYSVCVSG